MAKVKEPTELDMAKQDMLDAMAELRFAEANFRDARQEFFEIANEELTIAQKRLDTAKRKVQLLEEIEQQKIAEQPVKKARFTIRAKKDNKAAVTA